MAKKVKAQSSIKGNSHLARIHRAEHAVEEIERARERLRVTARHALGVTGTADAPPLRDSLSRYKVGWYPLVALSLLIIVDEFQAYGFLVLGPEIAASLGLGKTELAAMLALKTLTLTLAALPMAAYVQTKARRGALSIVTAFAWSTMTLFTGFVSNAFGMLGVLVANGASNASVRAVHPSLLVDTYPPEARVRALSFYRGADGVGNILAPLIVGLLTSAFDFTWRGVFVGMAITSFLVAVGAVRLRDPGFGRWDTSQVRKVVRRDAGGADPKTGEGVELRFFEIVRRLLRTPTIRRLLMTNAVLGMMLVPLYTFLFFFLDERWGMGPGARGLFFGVMPIFALSALRWYAPRGEALFRRDPSQVLKLGAIFLGGGVVALALAMFVPIFALMFVLYGTSSALFALLGPTINVAILSIIPPRMRPHVAALSGIFLSGVGGFAGLLLLGGLDRRFGVAGAIAALALPGIAAAVVLRGAAKTINSDLDRMVDDIVEEEEIESMSARGEHLPMLGCRHLDFSYGKVQVLFDVSFTVDEGEMVGLFGTNGAGKSTLLRVISGIGLPTRGTIRFRGADITYLDPERRLRLGIEQLPGGRGVFAPLTVIENLRMFAFSHGRNRKAVERGIESAFEAFPALASRMTQPASTLSGGEQQMLNLAQAFILKPRLLLIDELSLGLAPKLVAELLETVRRINAVGTAVVLVEQSVNVGLSLVNHAYFMEKGEIRFDGEAKNLLRRPDLLRSVFLEGAAKTLRS